MQPQTRLLIVGLLAALAATPAEAQRRQRRASHMPDAGMWAVGGSVGATAPNTSDLNTGLDVGGTVEGYVGPRLSVRGQLRTAWWSFDDRLGFTGTLQPTLIGANLLYNFEHGNWHPYVTAGVGRYIYQWREPGMPDGSNGYGGANVGAGLERFVTRDGTLTMEVLYHHVGDVAVPRAVIDGSYWAFTVGGKKYF
jgi:hypothetical protein